MRKKFLLISAFVIAMAIPFASVFAVKTVDCGNITRIPQKFVELTSWAVTILQVAVPIILVIMGSLDLLKGITTQKEEEIKKGQQILVKRLIVAVLIFFVFVVVKLLVSVVASVTTDTKDAKESTNSITECMNCFINGKEKCKK